MTGTAMKSDTQEIVVEEVFPHAPETIWKTLTDRRTDRPLARHDADRFRGGEGHALHLSDDAGGRVGRPHPLRGAGGEAERAAGLFVEERPCEQCRLRRAARHHRDFDIAKVEDGTRLRLVHSGFVAARRTRRRIAA